MKNTALVCLLLLLPVAAFAHHDETAPASKLRQLDALSGNLRCSGTAFASPMAPQHPTSAEVTTKWELDGQWLAFTYAEKKTSDNAMPFRVSGYMGYDPEMGKLVIGTVDNMGGYSTAASDGWDGDSIVFTGPWHMATQTVTGRDTFTRKGAQLLHTGEIEMDGKWVKLGEETCMKK